LASAQLTLGQISYTEQGWYERTAGVVTLPLDRPLTPQELETIAGNPLAVMSASADGGPAPAGSEPTGGLHVRADQFVFRVDAGDSLEVRLRASRFGRPHAGATVRVSLDASQLQGGDGLPIVAAPADAVEFPAAVVTNADGVAMLTISAQDPHNPRGYIDGQVYGIRPVLEETLAPGANYPFNQWDFISVHVWDAYGGDMPPTWTGGIHDILQQYANLYPVMDSFVDLADYDSVCEHRELLMLAFDLPSEDPNSMPVTRELSHSKRRAILDWLRAPGPDGKPVFGAGAEAHAVSAAAVAPAGAALPEAPATLRGGKATALRRRLGIARPNG
jgi:hypothetical protein